MSHTLEQDYVNLLAKYKDLERQLAEAQEREAQRLAAISTYALGYFDGTDCLPEFKSAALDDVIHMKEERERQLAECQAREQRLRKACRPFSSGGEWGKWKAWLVNGAPTRRAGIVAARMITEDQCTVDKALHEGEAGQ